MLVKPLALALLAVASASPLAARERTPAKANKPPQSNDDVTVANNGYDGWYNDQSECTSQGKYYCGAACVPKSTQCCIAWGDGSEYFSRGRSSRKPGSTATRDTARRTMGGGASSSW